MIAQWFVVAMFAIGPREVMGPYPTQAACEADMGKLPPIQLSDLQYFRSPQNPEISFATPYICQERKPKNVR